MDDTFQTGSVTLDLRTAIPDANGNLDSFISFNGTDHRGIVNGSSGFATEKSRSKNEWILRIDSVSVNDTDLGVFLENKRALLSTTSQFIQIPFNHFSKLLLMLRNNDPDIELINENSYTFFRANNKTCEDTEMADLVLDLGLYKYVISN
jgi:hypothetical protein